MTFPPKDKPWNLPPTRREEDNWCLRHRHGFRHNLNLVRPNSIFLSAQIWPGTYFSIMCHTIHNAILALDKVFAKCHTLHRSFNMQPSAGIYNISIYKILHEMTIYLIDWQNISHDKVWNYYNPVYINRRYKLLRLLFRFLPSALLLATIMSWRIVMGNTK